MNDLRRVEAPPESASPWRRRLRWAGALFLLAAAGFAGLVGFVYFRAGGAMQSAFDETDALDPGWRLEDIEASRAAIPDAENAALKVAALKRLMAGRPIDYSADSALTDLPPEAQLNERQLDALDVLLQAHGPAAVAEARSLIDFPRGRSAIAYSADFISTMLPHLQDHRQAAGLMRYDALARAQAGDADGAVRSAQAAVNAGVALGDEPVLITQLVRVACQTVGILAAERALAQGEPSEGVLAAFQRRLEEIEPEPLILYGLRGDRAGSDRFYQNLINGRIKDRYKFFQGLSSRPSSSPFPDPELLMLYVPGNITRQRAASLKYVNKGIEIIKRPPEQWEGAVAEWGAEAYKLPILPRMLAPAVTQVARGGQRHHAQLRSAIVMVAAERFRRKTGQWPTTIDELVKVGLLKAVPTDPYDGQPLRLRRLPDGLVVYSVGKDRADNGGTLNRQNPIADGADLGFRLWDVAARRQPPLPPKPEDEN
jgi:hypothetical protein